MTEFGDIKVGDRINVVTTISTYEGVVTNIGPKNNKYCPVSAIWAKGWGLQNGESNATSETYIRYEDMKKITFINRVKPKIQVGSTYLTPTGLKRKVVFSDEKTVLAENEDGRRHVYYTRLTSGWTLVPPEEWVNILNRGDINRTIEVSSKKFASLSEAWKDPISGTEAKGYICTVRVDENYNTSSV